MMDKSVHILLGYLQIGLAIYAIQSDICSTEK
nr:MAG TPA_asm: hypothetical protein [Caudoviricetes sp.]